MTEKKLTPRIGDRVIVSAGSTGQIGRDIPTTTGYVVAYDPTEEAFPEGQVLVKVDAGGPLWTEPGQFWVDVDRVAVVDREPIEWPKGWDHHPFTKRIRVERDDWVTKESFHRIRGPEGDHVAEHLDELLGGDS